MKDCDKIRNIMYEYIPVKNQRGLPVGIDYNWAASLENLLLPYAKTKVQISLSAPLFSLHS